MVSHRAVGAALFSLLLVALVGMLIATRARVGAVGVVAGVTGLSVRAAFADSALRGSYFARLGTIALCLVVGLGAMAIGGVKVHESTIKEFVIKGGSERMSLLELFGESRGFLVERSMANFRSSPVLGIGFGDPGDSGSKGEGIHGTHLTASAEKGFVATAVLEETGLVGFAAFALFVFGVLRLGVRQSMLGLAFFLCFLGVNVGEATFFSFGGIGSFGWACVASGFLIDCSSRDARYPVLAERR